LESSTDAFTAAGTTIANTTTSLTATNLTATTSYRAVVKSGTCAAINSSTATVTVSAPVAQTVSEQIPFVSEIQLHSLVLRQENWSECYSTVATVDSATGVVTGLQQEPINYSVTTTGGCVNTASRTSYR
jgi:hypothetical protein